jgi:hypothetical protein
MLFDKLVKFVEKNLSNENHPLENVIKQAKLFHFEEAPHNFILERKNDSKIFEELRLIEKTFFLPFRHTAIEDAASLIVLSTMKEEINGFGKNMAYVVFSPMLPKPNTLNDRSAYFNAYKKMHKTGHYRGVPLNEIKTSYGLEFGNIKPLQFSPSPENNNIITVDVMGKMHGILLLDKKMNIKNVMDTNKDLSVKDPALHQTELQSLQNVITAIEEVIYINNPKRFVIEELPPLFNKKKIKKLQRSHQRSKFTVLEPEKIRKIYGNDKKSTKNDRISPRAHQRRKHYRQYPDDPQKWPKAHGKILTIPTYWVGQKTFRKNNKIYKVRTDL